MSVWEFNAAVAGYLRAHVPQDDGAMSQEQEQALSALLDEVGQ